MTELQMYVIYSIPFILFIAFTAYHQGRVHGAEQEQHSNLLNPKVGDRAQYKDHWLRVSDIRGHGYNQKILLRDEFFMENRWVSIKDIEKIQTKTLDSKFEEMERFKRLVSEE